MARPCIFFACSSLIPALVTMDGIVEGRIFCFHSLPNYLISSPRNISIEPFNFKVVFPVGVRLRWITTAHTHSGRTNGSNCAWISGEKLAGVTVDARGIRNILLCAQS